MIPWLLTLFGYREPTCPACDGSGVANTIHDSVTGRVLILRCRYCSPSEDE